MCVTRLVTLISPLQKSPSSLPQALSPNLQKKHVNTIHFYMHFLNSWPCLNQFFISVQDTQLSQVYDSCVPVTQNSKNSSIHSTQIFFEKTDFFSKMTKSTYFFQLENFQSSAMCVTSVVTHSQSDQKFSSVETPRLF